MRSLATLQREFLDAVFAEGDADARLAIYRRNTQAARRGALAATYPVVRRLVGDAFFEEAARAFACGTVSTSGDLNDYGGGFPTFLGDYPHARTLPYLADVARLEWACHESEVAADATAFDFAALGRVPASELGALRFTLAPSVRLMASPHPIASIWEANQAGRDGTPRVAQGPENALAWRRDGEVRVASLDEGEWNALAAFSRGATLVEATAALGTGVDRFLGDALARHVREGVIAGFAA